ncbi:GNAT family N-acetyltransferase [Nonomuraea sp. NBC_01738]|uniref:GNAT family N-acetyltransferase n=1 Tax=Nonomuraea sp. NBC_01738 TaxID=2976003 RepID=UPI002E0EEBB5|nr:GNAT family N-acetyltransferase [Nonomuraea sp. NBC_01738]
MFDQFPEPARSQLRAAFDEGRTRPEWCFTEGTARVAFWAPYRGAEPVITWHFDPGPDSATGARVLRTGIRRLGATKMLHDIALPPGLVPTLDRADEHDALMGAGFTMEVERLRLEWTAAGVLPSDSGRLAYRPARQLPESELLDLLIRVSRGSLDHDTQAEVAAVGAVAEARAMYDDLVNRKGKPDWFVVGYAGGQPVGLVAPDDHSIAYVGVLPEMRGHGYIDDLLAHGTRTLAMAGLRRVVAATDVANTPAAAAFLRTGYAEVGRLFRYYWRSA